MTQEIEIIEHSTEQYKQELSVAEYAELMKCSPQKIHKMISAGKLKARKVKNNNNVDKWLIEVEDDSALVTIDALPVSRPISPTDLKDLIIKALAAGIGAGNEELQEQVFDLQKQVNKQSYALDQQAQIIEKQTQLIESQSATLEQLKQAQILVLKQLQNMQVK